MLLAPNPSTTLFSFGYWGSGNATPALVDGIDAAEALRGYQPPLWVDIRISRSVRAVGFRGHAFERLLGARYVWMRDLGNLSVKEHRVGIEIKDPSAAEVLLDRALDRPARRVIFFCSCEVPKTCHRYVVSKLVLQSARARRVDVTVAEWPGGEPAAITIEVSLATLRKVARGAQTTLPVPASMTVGEASALAWGTSARLHAGPEEKTILVGPAHFDHRGPHLKILTGVSTDGSSQTAFRTKYGYAPLGVGD